MVDNDKKLEDYSDEEMHTLLYGRDTYESELQWNDLHDQVREAWSINSTGCTFRKNSSEISEKTIKKAERFSQVWCLPRMRGVARLNQKALDSRIDGLNIAEMSALEVSELVKIIQNIYDPVSKPMIDTLTDRLQHLVDIGLGYLSLDRETGTLSGGEIRNASKW